MMNEERLGGFSISMDLIVEILKKLPAKSLMRFRCVSKQWSTIIGSRRDLIDSIVNRSLPPQKLPVLIFHHCVPQTFFTVSSTFSQSTKDAVSAPVSTDNYCFEYIHARGLICSFSSVSQRFTIYNPTTRQSIPLPDLQVPVEPLSQDSYCHFGYDPVMNQYKVLSVIVDVEEMKQTIHVLTLASNLASSWRRIQAVIDDDEVLLFQHVRGVCVDGTFYYAAIRVIENIFSGDVVLVSFDIKSERFSRVWAPQEMLKVLSSCVVDNRTLVNHLGKLGCIGYAARNNTSMWIMEDAQKQQWSKITFSLPDIPLRFLLGDDCNRFSGVTPAGEIFVIESCYHFNKSLYLYYYDYKLNSFRRIEIQGTSPNKIKKHRYSVKVFAIHDFVENPMWF